MKAFYVTILLGTLTYFNVLAQENKEFVFEQDPKSLDISGINQADVKSHVLGDGIAKKMVLLSDRYTQIVPATPTSPVEKTMVKKPIIYNSIKKLNKYYSKAVKKNEMDTAVAKAEFEKCLDIALIIYNKNTSQFEQTLKEAKQPKDILSVFNKVVIE